MSRAHFFLSPEGWPAPLRIAFVATFPISGPLLLAAWLAFIFGTICAGLLFSAGLAVLWVVAIVAYPIYALWTWLADLWFYAMMEPRK